MKLSVAGRAPLESGPDWDSFASDTLDDDGADGADTPPSHATDAADATMTMGSLVNYASEVRIRAVQRAEVVARRGRKWGSE